MIVMQVVIPRIVMARCFTARLDDGRVMEMSLTAQILSEQPFCSYHFLLRSGNAANDVAFPCAAGAQVAVSDRASPVQHCGCLRFGLVSCRDTGALRETSSLANVASAQCGFWGSASDDASLICQIAVPSNEVLGCQYAKCSSRTHAAGPFPN